MMGFLSYFPHKVEKWVLPVIFKGFNWISDYFFYYVSLNVFFFLLMILSEIPSSLDIIRFTFLSP